MARLIERVRSFFRKRAADEEIDQELAAHIDLATEDYIRQGMTAAEARRRALVSLGGMEQAKESHRDSRGLPAMDALLRDFRYAVRTLKRDAGLTTFAVLIIAIGVGASSTVFSVFNALFLRSLPFDRANELVWIANGTSDNLSAQTVQVNNLLDLRAQSQSLADVAAYSPFYGTGDIRLTGAGGEPERLTGVPVTEGFFQLLRVRPHVGRLFSAEECRWQAPKTVVLSHRFWQRRFDADPAVIGRSIMLDDAAATVIGVLPASFDFASIFAPGTRADLFVPFPLSPETNRRGNSLALIGRLRPGVDLGAVQAEATLIGGRIKGNPSEGRERNRLKPRLSMLGDRVSGKFRFASLVLVGAVGFVMLLVCANLSNLLLAKASARRREMAIRIALGAGRGQLIRQMLMESVVLACCGAVVGLMLAWGGTTGLARLEGTSIPLLQAVRVDGVVLGFTLLMAVITGGVFGLAPAIQASALTPQSALKEGGRGSVGSGDGWVRRFIVTAEIALVCVLLTGAGLLTRSLLRVLDVELGFDARNVLALRIDPGEAYPKYSQKIGYFDEALRAVRAVPGVEAAGLTDALPLGDNYGWRNWTVRAKGQVDEGERAPTALVRIVDDAFLKTMRISLRAGRGFVESDNTSSARVAIVNETLARRLWPGQDPVGRVFRTGDQEWRVVGVIGGVRYFGLERDSGSEIYLPIRQTGDFATVDLVIRGAQDSAALAPAVRAALKNVDARMPATEFRTMEQLVDKSVFPRRFVMMLLGGFALFGLVLAGLGIYAVISYSVSQRRKEIGIRIALGASAASVERRILMQTVRLAVAGIAIGVPASWMTARAIRGLLFGVTFSDPATFAAVLIVLAAIAALAGYLPARQASRLNPIDALRCD